MKIAIITGASSGMGREAARQLADRFSGLQEVWLIARRMDRMQELERTLPIPARCFAIDLTDASQRETLENELAARKPNVKLLVNASGFGKIGTVGNLPLDDETGMVELNCEALCAVTHMVLPYMSENSRILQFASAASFLPQPGFAVYAASKAYVMSFSRALRSEVRKKGITVTCVCPGPVDTAFFEGAEKYHKMPLFKKKSMADPKPVVEKAVYDAACGRALSIYGWSMKALFLACKILPHRLIIDLTAIFFKP